MLGSPDSDAIAARRVESPRLIRLRTVPTRQPSADAASSSLSPS
jgi:hypothetical protein